MEDARRITPGEKFLCIKSFYIVSSGMNFLEFEKGKIYEYQIPPTLPNNSLRLDLIYLKGKSSTYRSFYITEKNKNSSYLKDFFISISDRRKEIIDEILDI
jgi:hypothetical protein